MLIKNMNLLIKRLITLQCIDHSEYFAQWGDPW
jgi:hypothetical protein